MPASNPAFSIARTVAVSTARLAVPSIHLEAPKVAASTAVTVPPLITPSRIASSRSASEKLPSRAFSCALLPSSSAVLAVNRPVKKPATVPTGPNNEPAAAPAAPAPNATPVLGNCDTTIWNAPSGLSNVALATFLIPASKPSSPASLRLPMSSWNLLRAFGPSLLRSAAALADSTTASRSFKPVAPALYKLPAVSLNPLAIDLPAPVKNPSSSSFFLEGALTSGASSHHSAGFSRANGALSHHSFAMTSLTV